MKSPLVTIVLPTHNGAQYIAQALKSVLAQTYTNWELLVIDDGSTDETIQVLEAFILRDKRIRMLKNEKKLGIQAALNHGLSEAVGKYIARIDDDDVWIDSTKLDQQVFYMEQHDECVLVGTNVVVIDEMGIEKMRYQLPQDDKLIRERMLVKNCFAHSSVVFRRETIETVGRYSQQKKHRHVEDYELWLRLGITGTMHNLDMFGLAWRVRGQSITAKNKTRQFLNNVRLVTVFIGKYPNGVFAFVFACVRFVVYQMYQLFPSRLHHWLFKRYKQW